MEVLKSKIFKVLTNKISVSEFENWLYNSKEILSKLNVNSFYFDVISVNYKSDDWNSKLLYLAKKNLSKNLFEVLAIEIDCSKILASESFNEIYEIVKRYWVDFDYDEEFDISWRFYDLEYKFDSFEYNMTLRKKQRLIEEVKYYANQVVSKLDGIDTLNKKRTILFEDLEPFERTFNYQKISLKQKIFAFFKKS